MIESIDNILHIIERMVLWVAAYLIIDGFCKGMIDHWKAWKLWKQKRTKMYQGEQIEKARQGR